MMKVERDSAAAAHWTREQYESATNPDGPSQRFAWVIENESAESELPAFLVARKLGAEWELENMVVALTVRRQGLGMHLLSELIQQARAERPSSIHLEVRESNQGARELYEKAGFERVGLRKSYYADPSEDAILYRLSFY
jgi:[ribosomal protein S18]-alanine N-acetyltransferase